jgi:hypothetical protein
MGHEYTINRNTLCTSEDGWTYVHFLRICGLIPRRIKPRNARRKIGAATPISRPHVWRIAGYAVVAAIERFDEILLHEAGLENLGMKKKDELGRA